MTPPAATLPAAMKTFAEERIRTRPSLAREGAFPQDIWTALGAAGLLDPARPDLAENRTEVLARTARAMTEAGGNLGVALSFLIHHLTAANFLSFPGPEDSPERAALAAAVRTGAATLSLAVSEPAAGGHPKFMSARADRQGEAFVLTGEKAYLTNGPLARAFAVIAVTGESAGKKEFSAFLVDRDAPGLRVLPAMDIPFFKPSPHGGIRLDGVRVGPQALIGREGRAFADTVLRFRAMEDAGMTGAVTGAMDFVLKAAAAGLPGERKLDADCLATLGRFSAMHEASGVLSERIARDAENEDVAGIHLYFRELAAGFVRECAAFIGREGIRLAEPAGSLVSDLSASAGLGKTVSKLRLQKLGSALFAG